MAHRSQPALARQIAAIAVPALTAVVTATAASPVLAAAHPATAHPATAHPAAAHPPAAHPAAVHPPAAYRSAATGWRVIRTFASPNAVLDDVTGFADGTAWASGSTSAPTPVVYHLAGGTWTATALPGSSVVFAPSLSATSKTNVWASLANEPMVARLTGKGWVTHSFSSGSDEIGIDGVVTTGPKNTWAFTFDFNTGQESAEHYTGSTWKPTALPVEVDGGGLTGLVSASGPGNIWTWAFNPKNNKTTTLHYNGHQWTAVGIPANLVPSTQHLLGKQILAESPTDVWATANNNMATGSIILLHNKGRGWARITGQPAEGPARRADHVRRARRPLAGGLQPELHLFPAALRRREMDQIQPAVGQVRPDRPPLPAPHPRNPVGAGSGSRQHEPGQHQRVGRRQVRQLAAGRPAPGGHPPSAPCQPVSGPGTTSG